MAVPGVPEVAILAVPGVPEVAILDALLSILDARLATPSILLSIMSPFPRRMGVVAVVAVLARMGIEFVELLSIMGLALVETLVFDVVIPDGQLP